LGLTNLTIYTIIRKLCEYKGIEINEETIKKYIQEQENADILADKMSVKESKDPFMGS
jgi:hypothetical protein